MPNGLSVGAGIANGANAFVQSFLRARQLKNQEKLQQNAFVIQVLTSQLEDENLPYYKRAKILDEIPRLLGVKNMDRNLSAMMGLDQLNEQEVQDPNAPAIEGKQGTPASSITDQNTGTSINIRGTEATSDVPAGSIKYGNLTPAIIKKQLKDETEKTQAAMDIAKQRAIFEAQSEILNKGGYTQKIAEGYRGEDYVITMSNGKDTKDIVLPNYTPAIIRKAEIQYKGRGQSGKLAQLQQANEIVRAYEDNPTPDLEPQYKAAKGLLDDFEKTGQLKEAQIQSLTLGNTGQKPPTITAKMTDEDRDRTALIQVQKDIDEATGELQGIETSIAAYDKGGAKDKTQAAFVLNTAENELRKLEEDGYGPADSEWKAANTKVKNAKTRYETLEDEYTKLQQRKATVATKLSQAQSRRNLVGGSSVNSPNPEFNSLSPLAQAYVQKYFQGDVTKAKAAYLAKFGKPLQ